ncbi:hypothetical protein RFI_07587, partial [Reticulomyxa filosa]
MDTPFSPELIFAITISHSFFEILFSNKSICKSRRKLWIINFICYKNILGRANTETEKAKRTKKTSNRNSKKNEGEEEELNFEQKYVEEPPMEITDRRKKVEESRQETYTKKTNNSLRTSEHVYNRLLWDDSFFEERTDKCTRDNIWIGYTDRKIGDSEIRLTQFKPIAKGGDIPFHHVNYFRDGSGELLWYRKYRFDNIFKSGDTSLLLSEYPDFGQNDQYRQVSALYSKLTNQLLGLQLSMTAWQSIQKAFDCAQDEHHSFNRKADPLDNLPQWFFPASQCENITSYPPTRSNYWRNIVTEYPAQ